ncbi:hypothetical protein LTS08_003337 [Lithohypha guttulata]|nr:hypothetical protein LTS08_003337 [Lithohypha guttulata]
MVEAFPIPEDRQPGYKKKKQRYETEDAELTALLPDQSGKTIEQALSHLNLNHISNTKSDVPSQPFRFLDLPSELRNRIYHTLLFSLPDHDGSSSGSRISPLLVSKQLHLEASHILYSHTRFPLFPLQLFESPPTILDLPSHYHPSVTNLLLTLGPSWTNPPKSWRVTPRLSRVLKKLTSLRTLRVFVEFDPSHPAFKMHRISENYYTDFCGELLGDILETMPQCGYVELDGNSGVDVNGPLVRKLREEVKEAERELRWGGKAGWAHLYDKPEVSRRVVENVMFEDRVAKIVDEEII